MVRLNAEIIAERIEDRTITSSKAMPACFISTQGRIDQDE